MSERIVHIEREGPLALAEAERFNDPARDVGIYQLYGPHCVYDERVLLYIGKAERQPFGVRIAKEGWRNYERGSEVCVHVGRLSSSASNGVDPAAHVLELVETLLIHVHGPGYNASKVADPPGNPELKALRILNWRNHGSLLPEVSGARWLSKPPGAAPRPAGMPN